MENELFIILAGALVSGLTHLCKKFFGDKVNPLYFVAGLSVVLGGGYYLLQFFGVINAELKAVVVGMFASAVAVYNVLKAYMKAKA